MIKKLIALTILLPIFDIVLIYIISNYVSLYIIGLETMISIILALFILNNLKSSNNLKLLNIINGLKNIKIIIFKFVSFVCLLLPGIITDLIGILILIPYLQDKIKYYILYNILKNNDYNNEVFEGSFTYINDRKNVTNKQEDNK